MFKTLNKKKTKLKIPRIVLIHTSLIFLPSTTNNNNKQKTTRRKQRDVCFFPYFRERIEIEIEIEIENFRSKSKIALFIFFFTFYFYFPLFFLSFSRDVALKQ